MAWLKKHGNFYFGNAYLDAFKIITSKEKMRQLLTNSFYSNSIYLLASNVVGAVLGFVFWIIAARFYTVEQVGISYTVISAIGLLGLFSAVGLGEGIVRFIPGSGKNATQIINTAMTITLITSLVAGVIFLAGLGIWSPKLMFIKDNPVYMISFILLTMIFPLATLMDNWYLAWRRADFIFYRGATFNVLKLGFAIVVAAIMSSIGILVSWSISLLIAFIIGIFFFIPRMQKDYRPSFVIKRDVVSNLFKFSFVNYLFNLLWSGTAMLLPIIVVNLLGGEASGYFSIAWSLGTVLMMIPSAISTSLFAEGSNDHSTMSANIKRSLWMSFILLVPSILILYFIAGWLLSIFKPAYAANSITLLRILLVSTLPVTINIIYINIKRVEKKLSTILLASAALAVINIGLSYILLPRIGINGVGYAWLVSHGIISICIIVTFVWRRTFKKASVPHKPQQ